MARVRFSQPKPFRSWVPNCWHRLLKALSRSKSHGERRREPLRFSAGRPCGQQVLPAVDFLHAEAATGDIQHGQAEQTFVTEDGSQQVVAMFVEQGFVA